MRERHAKWAQKGLVNPRDLFNVSGKEQIGNGFKEEGPVRKCSDNVKNDNKVWAIPLTCGNHASQQNFYWPGGGGVGGGLQLEVTFLVWGSTLDVLPSKPWLIVFKTCWKITENYFHQWTISVGCFSIADKDCSCFRFFFLLFPGFRKAAESIAARHYWRDNDESQIDKLPQFGSTRYVNLCASRPFNGFLDDYSLFLKNQQQARGTSCPWLLKRVRHRSWFYC